MKSNIYFYISYFCKIYAIVSGPLTPNSILAQIIIVDTDEKIVICLVLIVISSVKFELKLSCIQCRFCEDENSLCFVSFHMSFKL